MSDRLMHYCLGRGRRLWECVLGFIARQPQVDAGQSKPRYEARVGCALRGASTRYPLPGLGPPPTGTAPYR